MGLFDALLGQQGVNLTGGGLVGAPDDKLMETRFDDMGNAYQADVRTPLHAGHTKASSFNIPDNAQGLLQPEMPTEFIDLGRQQVVQPSPQMMQPVPQSSFMPGSQESMAQNQQSTIAPWSPEQTDYTDARNVMSGYKGGERLAQRDSGTFQDLTPNVDPSKAMQMLEMFKKEGKALTDLQFGQAMVGLGMGDILKENRSQMNNVNESVNKLMNDNTNDFGEQVSADSFGQSDYDLNQQRQDTLDGLMMQDSVGERADNSMAQMHALNGTTPNVIPEPKPESKNTNLSKFGSDLVSDSQRYRDSVTGAWDATKEFGSDAWDLAKKADKAFTKGAVDAYDNGLLDSVTDAYDMLSKGTSDVVMSIPSAYSEGVGGITKAIKTATNVALGEEYFDENDGEILQATTPDYNYPAFGNISENVLSYAGGGTGAFKLLSKAPTLVKYLGAVMGGTSTLDPSEGNLSSMLQDEGYRSALTDYLASSPDQDTSSLEKLKFYSKTFLEDTILGFAAEGVVATYQGIKNNPDLKQKIIQELGDVADKAETMVGKIPGVETEQTLRKDMAGSAFGGKRVKEQAEVDDLGFYSKAEQAILDSNQNTFQPSQVASVSEDGKFGGFLASKNVSLQEIKEMNLLDMLDAKQAKGDKVTKQELVDYIRTNRTKLSKEQYSGSSSEDGSDIYLGTSDRVDEDSVNWEAHAEDLLYDLGSENWEFDAITKQMSENYPDLYPSPKGEWDKEKVDSMMSTIKDLDSQNSAVFTRMQEIAKSEGKTVGSYGRIIDKEYDLLNTQHKSLLKDMESIREQVELEKEYNIGWSGDLKRELNAVENSNAWTSIKDDRLRDDVEEAAHQIAQKQYMDNPYREWDVPVGDEYYTVYGNDDVGYRVTSPWDNDLTPMGGVYDRAQVEEIIYTHASDEGLFSGTGSTRWSDWTTPNLDVSTYREVPIIASPRKGQRSVTRSEIGGHAMGGVSDENTVAHLRMSDKTDAEGNRVLFIEELQSDWVQTAREVGTTPEENVKALQKALASRDEMWDKSKVLGKRLSGLRESGMTHSKAYGDLRSDLIDLDEKIKLKDRSITKIKKGHIPRPPLEKDKWMEDGMKTALKIASDEGYDRVAWTTAEQQIDLYGKVYKDLYTNLYDKKMPTFGKKYAKQQGGKSGITTIYGDDSGQVAHHYIDITKDLSSNVQRQSTHIAAPFIPVGGGLLGEDAINVEASEEEPKDGILNNVKSWKPNNKLSQFVKMMENDPLRVGNTKVTEYDDVGHKAKGYGTKSGLLAQDTEEEASKALNSQLVKANKAVDRLVKIDLNEDQRNALVSLVYNIGATGFGKSNALKALNNGNIKTFLKEAFDPKKGFVKSEGKIVKGLVNRRAREKSIFTKGNYGN